MSTLLARLKRFALDGPDDSFTIYLLAMLWPWLIVLLTWFVCDVLRLLLVRPVIAVLRFVRHWWLVHLHPVHRFTSIGGSIVRTKVGE